MNRLVLTTAAAVLALAPATGAQAAALQHRTSVAALVLPAKAVGAGYHEQSRKDGIGVTNYVTLALCGFSFPSERLRTDRRQVNYVNRHSAVKVSNEVVSYAAGGTDVVLAELKQAIRQCPIHAVVGPVDGQGPQTHKVVGFKAPGLLTHAVSVLETVNGRTKGKPFHDVVAETYQVHGDILSAVYVQGGTVKADEAEAGRAGRAVATRLRHDA